MTSFMEFTYTYPCFPNKIEGGLMSSNTSFLIRFPPPPSGKYWSRIGLHNTRHVHIFITNTSINTVFAGYFRGVCGKKMDTRNV